MAAQENSPIVIKKYANRRLYNTATSAYVTLDHLAEMVREGEDFIVYDAKTGQDITRSVLTQIIVEEEGRGQSLLPIGFLRRLICLYGDGVQAFVPRYLEYAMENFERNQSQMRRYVEDAFGGLFPFAQFEKMGREQMALFESAMSALGPFARPSAARGEDDAAPEPETPPADEAPPEPRADAVERLKRQLEAMQAQLDDLKKRG